MQKKVIDPEPIIKYLADRCLMAKGLECSILGSVIDLLRAAPDTGKKWISVSERMPELEIDFADDESGERIEFEISEFVIGATRDGEMHIVRYETGPCYTGWSDVTGRKYDIRYWMPKPDAP